jgi:hypothetical protein
MARGRPRKIADDVLMKSAEMIGWAIGGIEREIAQTRERLDALMAQAETLRARAGNNAPRAARTESAAAEPAARTRRRRMSPEARKRISEMMKKRWAERKRGKSK